MKSNVAAMQENARTAEEERFGGTEEEAYGKEQEAKRVGLRLARFPG